MTDSPSPPSSFWPYLPVPLLGAATGYLAVHLQTRFAPVGLFPALIGVVTGAAVAAVLNLGSRPTRQASFVSATVAALVCLATVHYGSYLQARAKSVADFDLQQRIVQAFPQGGGLQNLPRPLTSFGEYVDHELVIGRKLGPLPITGGRLILWWFLDGLLLWIGATVAALMIGERRPASAPLAPAPPATPTSTSEAS